MAKPNYSAGSGMPPILALSQIGPLSGLCARMIWPDGCQPGLFVYAGLPTTVHSANVYLALSDWAATEADRAASDSASEMVWCIAEVKFYFVILTFNFQSGVLNVSLIT